MKRKRKIINACTNGRPTLGSRDNGKAHTCVKKGDAFTPEGMYKYFYNGTEWVDRYVVK